MAEPMPDPGPEPDPTDPWPFLTDEDHAWLDQLLDYADELATLAEVPLPKVMADLTATVLDHDGYGWPDRAPEQARRWTVTDDGSAEWAMAKVAEAEAELDKLNTQAVQWEAEAADRLARIRAWYDHRARRHLATKAFMEAHLVRYALDQRAADPKAKTLVLPSGAVKTTEQKPKVAVADEPTVVEWAVDLLGRLDTSWLAEVAPEQPRKLYVQKLRDHTEVVEVIDYAQLLLAGAELITWVRHGYEVPDDAEPAGRMVTGAERQRCPQPGDGWPSPAEATDLVARVEVLASHLEVHGPDGLPVPGTHVEPGGVTAKVVPA